MAPHPRATARLCGAPGTQLPPSIHVRFTGRVYPKGQTCDRDLTLIYSPCKNCGALTEYRVVAPSSQQIAA